MAAQRNSGARAGAKDRIDAIIGQWGRERPDIDAVPMEIVGRIQRAAQALRPRLDEVHERFGLRGEAFDVLASLRRAGPPFELTPGQLANQMMLTSGTMTNRIDRLEEAALVARRPNPADGRGTFITLSKKGRALIDRAVAEHVANEARLLSALSAAELRTLSQLLRRLLISWGDTDD